MRRTWKSLRYALEGFGHAFMKERNIRFIVCGCAVVVLLGLFVRLLTWEWCIVILTCGTFLAIELLNTAIERLSDVLDHERKLNGRNSFHQGMKWTKDVAASASLVSLVITGMVVCVVFWPYGKMFVNSFIR